MKGNVYVGTSTKTNAFVFDGATFRINNDGSTKGGFQYDKGALIVGSPSLLSDNAKSTMPKYPFGAPIQSYLSDDGSNAGAVGARFHASLSGPATAGYWATGVLGQAFADGGPGQKPSAIGGNFIAKAWGDNLGTVRGVVADSFVYGSTNEIATRNTGTCGSGN